MARGQRNISLSNQLEHEMKLCKKFCLLKTTYEVATEPLDM